MRRQARLIAAIAGVAVFCLILYLFVIGPRRSELSDTQAQVGDAKVQQLQLRQQLAVLRDLQDRAPELQADLDQIRGFVPKSDEVPNFIFQVQEAANKSGVGFVQITPELPKTPPEGAPLAEVRITIRSQGGYFSQQDFVRRLYDLDRALRIDTMTLGTSTTTTASTSGTSTTAAPSTTTGTANPDQIEMTITARIFFELPEGVAPSSGGTTTTPTPTTSPVPEPAPSESPSVQPTVNPTEAGESLDQIRESPAPNPTAPNPTP